MEPEPEHATPSISIGSYSRLVRSNRNFRRLWMAQIVSEIGDWFYTLSIYTLLLQLTGRASSVALALVLQVLPQTLVGPTAGVVNDRLRRKQVMIAADLVRFAVVLAMLLVRSRSMVWLVYPLLLAETIMAAFFEPARSSVIPNIAAQGEVLIANTLSSATWSLNLVIGASVGGVVAAFFGRDAVFILNALSFLASAFLIAGMRFAEPHAESAAPLRPRDLVDFSPVLEGIRYVRSHRTLLPTVFAKAGELMIGPSWVIFTVMGAHEFAVHWRNVDAGARIDAGNEHPAGRSRFGSAGWSAGLGALGGPQRPEAATRHPLRLSHHRGWIRNSRRQPHGLDGCGVRRARAHGRINGLGLLYDTAAASYRRPLPRPRIFCRPGFLNADHRGGRLPVRTLARCRGRRSHGRDLDWIGHADSGCVMGAGDACGEEEVCSDFTLSSE